MSESHSAQDMLSEIDRLQDEVLRQLDELNSRVERALAEFGGAAPAIAVAAAPDKLAA